MTKLNLILITLFVVLSGCGDKSFVINGTLMNSEPGTFVYLDRLGATSIEGVDTAAVDETGNFRLSYKSSSPAFYLIRTSNESFITTMIEPGEKITIKAQADSLNFPYELAGSPGTQLILDYNNRLQETLAQLGELNQVYSDNIDSPDLESIMNDLDTRAREILKQMNEYTKNYIDDNLTSLVTLMALYQQVVPEVYVLNPEEDIDYFVKVDSALFSMFPDYEPVATLHEQIATLVNSMGGEIMGDSSTGTGAVAPEITLPGTDGVEKSLSSTRGNIVLLDFWAAWCPPCRMENPNLVKAYEKYHSKGFDIFQVSLDKDHESWIKGIEEDNLGKWHHVSDLKYWESSVVSLYGIQGIPTNYLLDEDGRIIGSNLRGEALNDRLEELFK